MRILAVFITIINIFAIFAVPTFAENELSSFDTQGLEQKINDETDLSFSDMFYDVITGNLSEVVDDIKNKIFDTFASEIKNNSDYIKTIVIVSLLCGILNTISSDLKDKSVAELVFFVGEVMVLTVAVLSLKETINIMRGYISSITGIISASIPFLSGVLVAGGKSRGNSCCYRRSTFICSRRCYNSLCYSIIACKNCECYISKKYAVKIVRTPI